MKSSVNRSKMNVAVVGLGFGAEFIPIYQRHPHANLYAICQRSKTKLNALGDAFGVTERYADYQDLLKDPNIDAVHINTPIPDHASMAIAALKAGKHVACTVWYATHCVGPVCALAGADAEYVSCFGSGTIREELIEKYHSPFAVETTHIKLSGSDLSARIHRSLFDVARQYRESFDVYGSKASVEWPLIEHEPLVMHRAKLLEAKIPKCVKAPDYASRLPKSIRGFTTQGVYDLAGKQNHLSFVQGSGHGGSHPHLAHEFIMALVEKREPFPNARQSANWTCVGLCAHQSAMKGGGIVSLPDFSLCSR